jgi:hypothetical protein
MTNYNEYAALSLLISIPFIVMSTMRYVPAMQRNHHRLCSTLSLVSTLWSILYPLFTVTLLFEDFGRVQMLDVLKLVVVACVVLCTCNFPVIVEVTKRFRARDN